MLQTNNYMWLIESGYRQVLHTVNVERFAGLNIHGFSPMKFLWKYFHGALATSVYCLSIAKIHGKTFAVLSKTAKV